jgi:phosphopantothenoylcysteine decarboxylase/phosphopantothenate--cysteine ligase
MWIALGVTGGIAAYKACEIVRGLDQAGASTQVILTENAKQFVTPLTLQALSRNRVMLDPFDLSNRETIQHVELTRKIAAFVVAPATANCLAKLARGVADDLLSTFYTAVTCPVVIAPAMNTRMWLNPATQENVSILRGRGVTLVGPASGRLAEAESGWGRLAEPDEIVRATLDAARRSEQLAGKTVVVTAGPTREAVDPVRYLSNRSSGKMGYALAAAARRRGARVILVSGPVALAPPWGVEVVSVETAEEMRSAVQEAARNAHAVLMAAAVSDYAPRRSESKIKKSGGSTTLVLDEGPDILAELGREKGDRVLVGFAAESDDLIANAASKLETKNLDYIVANDISVPGQGIDADQNAVTILDRNGGRRDLPRAPKGEIAEAIVDRVLGRGGEG